MKKFALLFFLLLTIGFFACQKEFLDSKNSFKVEKRKNLVQDTTGMGEFFREFYEERFYSHNYVIAFNPAIEDHLGDFDISKETPNRSNNELTTTELKNYFRSNRGKRNWIENKYGFPIWTHTKTLERVNGFALIVPIAKESSSHIEALLFAFKNQNGKWKTSILDRKKIPHLKSKNKLNSGNKLKKITKELALTFFYISIVSYLGM